MNKWMLMISLEGWMNGQFAWMDEWMDSLDGWMNGQFGWMD